MTPEEKKIIFDCLDRKKACKKAFADVQDEKMISHYDSQVQLLLSLLDELNIYNDYFNRDRG